MTSPAWSSAVAVTKSDTTEVVFEALYIGGTGDVAIEDFHGQQTTFVAVPAGGYVICRGRKVLETGTDATSIVAIS